MAQEQPEVSPETEDEMRARFFETTLEDFEAKTEAFYLTVTPLGDSVGYRIEVHLTDGEAQSVFASGASHRSALTAGSMAIARALTRIEEAVNGSEDDDEEAEIES